MNLQRRSGFRDAGQTEAADGQAGAGGDVGDRLGGRADNFCRGSSTAPGARWRAGVMVAGCWALARWAARGTTSSFVAGGVRRVVGTGDRQGECVHGRKVAAQVEGGDRLAAAGAALGRGWPRPSPRGCPDVGMGREETRE